MDLATKMVGIGDSNVSEPIYWSTWIASPTLYGGDSKKVNHAEARLKSFTQHALFTKWGPIFRLLLKVRHYQTNGISYREQIHSDPLQDRRLISISEESSQNKIRNKTPRSGNPPTKQLLFCFSLSHPLFLQSSALINLSSVLRQ